jgi:hypothetical protein
MLFGDQSGDRGPEEQPTVVRKQFWSVRDGVGVGLLGWRGRNRGASGLRTSIFGGYRVVKSFSVVHGFLHGRGG